MEPYYVEQPFNIENIQDVILRNGQIFTGEKSRIFIDSFDQIIEKVPQKEFAKKFSEFTSKMRDLGATIVLTADLTKYAKETSSLLEDNAQCVIDLIKTGDDDKSRELKVRKANGTNMSKTEAELVHVDPSKGLVFV
jgi:archaellum biogenesis ATPase FlaH